MRPRPLHVTLPSLLILALAASGGPAPPESAAIPDWVLVSWEQHVGTWVADNSAYQDDVDTVDAYATEWRWGLGNKSLVGRLYGIEDGREVATFWEFREYWHPGEGRLIAMQFSGNGTVGIGPSERTGDGAMEILQTFHSPSGHVFRVGHRSTLKGDELTTRSFDVSEDGVWTDRRTYVWHRQR